MSKKSRNISNLDTEDNSTVYNRLRRNLQSCSYCKPNKGENSNRQEKRSWKRDRKRKQYE